MDIHEARRRFAGGRVARLATVRPNGGPHLVPVTFAVDGDTIYTAIDDKPKRTRRLRRLDNLRAQPRCTLLVDEYDDDWSRLWWVRADGVATIVEAPPASHPGIAALTERYATYRRSPPTGPLIAVTVTRWSGWSAS